MTDKICAIFFLLLLFGFPQISAAADSGDIFFSNHTTEKEIISGKTPTGVVLWTHEDGNGGIAIALDQPPMKSFKKAANYCKSLRQGNRYAGEWHLPTLLEFFPIDKMQGHIIDGRRLEHINDRLKNIRGAQRLKNEYYLTSTNNGSSAVAVNPFTGDIKEVPLKKRLYFRCVTGF